jgi:alpha-beta hydrolase superfamily lysophospholipase
VSSSCCWPCLFSRRQHSCLLDTLLRLKADDLYTFVGVVEQRVGGRLPAASTFLGGQSMGGLVAALGALRCQDRWAGLIIFSGAMGVVWTPVLRCARQAAAA